MMIRHLLLAAMALMPAHHAAATCYKVTSVGAANTTATTAIRPGEGTAGSWAGACDTCNGSLGIPSVINVSDPGFQPYGSLIASSVAPFTQYGSTSGYNPEYVFFRCEAKDTVYEMFSTNGDDVYSGWYQGGDSVGNSLGIRSAYRTAWPNVLLRLTHLETGQLFTDVWQQRPLTGLDIDSRGYQLVKAKNLSAVRAEIFSAPKDPSYNYYSDTASSQLYAYSQPAAYIAIKGPGLSYPTVGQTQYGNWSGWYGNWPGAIGLYNRVTLKRYPTCSVSSVTPYVVFPSISVSEINAGSSRVMPVQISIRCQSAAVSSTSANGTAIGIKASSGALAASSSLGLVNAQGGLAYLVSDRYGQSGIAQGVGIRLLRNGTSINLLANEDSAKGSGAAGRGWYPVIGSAATLTSTVNGVSQYTETFQARLEKLSTGTMPAVSPGKVEATAQVVIRVQ